MKKSNGRTKKSTIKKKQTKSLSNEVVYILLSGMWLIIIISLHTGRGGVLGNWINTLLFSVFGNMSYLYMYAALLATILLLTKEHHALADKKKIGAGIALITVIMLLAGLFDAELIYTIRNQNYMSTINFAMEKGLNQAGYGMLAAVVLYWLVFSIGRIGTGILLVTIASASIWLTSPRLVLWTAAKCKAQYKRLQLYATNRKKTLKNNAKKSGHLTLVQSDEPAEENKDYHEHPQLLQYEPVRDETTHQYVIDTKTELKENRDKKKTTDDGTGNVEDTLRTQMEKKESGSGMVYQKPSLSLLKPKQMDYQRTDRRKMLSKAKLLEETLASFGVEAKVIKVTQGPTITRYELQPSKGVKVSKVVNLNDDIALNLAASSIRIEAPIPGKAAIGIEIPNDEVSMVPLRDLLDTAEYNNFKNPLPFVLGKNIAGDPVVFDINKMPHLLVAGATGSGKSVCINTLILSLLYKSTPDEVKLLMIDPKVVELNIYNGIPHLMIPVVTDPKKATGALRWAVTEMEERYHKFADNGVRDIAGFNEKVKEEKLPYIVVIIDELADLMLVAAKEVEDYICRLAQMARAAGIHLIIATQRPSVDVITGIIKANIPSRVAFSVASQVDSRIILDMGGAEKLLGKGDMLFHPIGLSKPVRIQGSFVSEEEVKRVVEFLKEQSGEPKYEEEILDKLDSVSEQSGDHESDDVFQEALRIAFDNQQISISMLQRKLKMGYNRAARLIDEMESKGYVGPNEGTKPRKVISRPLNNNDYTQNPSNIREE